MSAKGTGNGNGNGGAKAGYSPEGASEREPGMGMSARKEILGIVERNEQSYWTRIGTAFENRDGSWNLKFDYWPARSEMKVQLRDPLPPREPRENGV